MLEQGKGSPSTAFDSSGRPTRRAYSGTDVRSTAPVAYAWEFWAKVSGMENPSGYLHRVGQTQIARRNCLSPWGSPFRLRSLGVSVRQVHPGSVRAMDSERRLPNVRDIWRLALAIIGVIAIIQELRKPQDERTWHGKVVDIVPYDFRMPTIGRVRNTYWNPKGQIFPGKVFGVGWALNFGVLTRMLGKRQDREESNPQPSAP